MTREIRPNAPGSPVVAGDGHREVSVVVPAYNAEHTLARALDSLLAQTEPAWHAIVVDDGSTDATAAIASAYATRDRRFALITRTNGGESAARNTGVGEARAQWLLFLDADDWIAPDYLAHMLALIETDSSLDGVICRHARVAADGEEIPEAYVPAPGDLFPVLARRAAFPIHACVIRRERVEEAGGFDESLKTSPDWDLWQRIARTGARFGIIGDVLAYYRMSPQSASLDGVQLFRDGMRVLRQGHSQDPRVPNPAPEHAGGEPSSGVISQQYYLLSWCAGLVIGTGGDLARLLQRADVNEPFATLHPPAVAQCLFESIPLPTCQSPRRWEGLWTARQSAIIEFLEVLEHLTHTPQLAGATVDALKAMIIDSSPIAALVMDRMARTRADADAVATRVAASLQNEIDAVRSENQSLRSAGDALTEALAAHRAEAAREHERLQAALALHDQRAAAAESALDDLRRHHQQLEAHVTSMRHSPEWQIGHAVWNTARLSVVGGHLKTLNDRIRNISNRVRLTRYRLAQRAGVAPAQVVVAACWDFPIYSQTFVYQEIEALRAAGFDYQVFCCRTNGTSQLHARFRRLWRRRVVLVPDWNMNLRDLDHFRRTRPERVDMLLDLLERGTGLSREALLQESIVMMGFTFSRHVELAGARYLHTYFFYDQSFMALMAGVLLDLPRGITAYADHMLSDYRFKCVPLHLELADIVVATSARIRSELLALSGGRWAEKVIVKPNGIDTSVFAVTPPTARLERRPPEIIAVNRLEPKKGLTYLIEAVDILGRRNVSLTLTLVGAADMATPGGIAYHAELTGLVERLRLGDRVSLAGMKPQEQILDLLKNARLFIAPYVEVESGDKDGIPTALLEAMAAGLPIVATDAGSIQEAMTHGVEGLCVTQRDPAALADAIEQLLTDESTYTKMAHAARVRAVSAFDITVTERALHERIHHVRERRAGGWRNPGDEARQPAS